MQEPPAPAFARLRRRLDEYLFLAAPPAQTRLRRWELALATAALLVLAVVLQVLRVGPMSGLESLWAEDGQIFFQHALILGFGDTVFQPYAGYLVVIPRLIGELGVLVPLGDAAATMAIASALLVALCGLVVWHASAAHIRDPYLRGTLVALTVLAPVAGLESVLSASYSLWYLLFAAFWLLLWRPATAWGAALGALFLLAIGLSTPGLWFFAPVAALRALAIRDGRDLLVVGGFAIGALVQLPVLLANRDASGDPVWTADIWTAYVQRVVDGATFGERVGGFAWSVFGWPFLVALLAVLAAGLVFAWRRAPASARWLAGIAIATSLVMFVASAYQRAVGTAMVWPAGMDSGNAGRYAIVPALLLVTAALVLVDRLQRRDGAGWRRWIGVATVAVLLGGLATSFYVGQPEVRGTPAWRDSLESAGAVCHGEDLPEGRIAISPPNFGVVIPCEDLPSPSTAPRAR